MTYTNLLAETLEVLTEHSKTTEDVLWIGSSDGEIATDWASFAAIAENVNYNSGFGGNEIAGDLVIVGSDWWLERGEYDGSEWWEFKAKPQRSDAPLPLGEVRNENYGDKVAPKTTGEGK
jgi:hypothetical protein